MRDLHLERVLESLERCFGVSPQHAKIHAILQPFIRWFNQKADHEAVGTHLATRMPIGCGTQAEERDEGNREPGHGHMQSA
jgi:hypothetical protein